jgi:hypothetical protein
VDPGFNADPGVAELLPPATLPFRFRKIAVRHDAAFR